MKDLSYLLNNENRIVCKNKNVYIANDDNKMIGDVSGTVGNKKARITLKNSFDYYTLKDCYGDPDFEIEEIYNKNYILLWNRDFGLIEKNKRVKL